MLSATVVGVAMMLSGYDARFAFGLGAILCMLQRFVQWHIEFGFIIRTKGSLQHQETLRQQEQLVELLASQVQCPWGVWVVGWFACTIVFITSLVLAVTVGQLVVLCRAGKPHVLRWWLKVCVVSEALFWVGLMWVAVRTAAGLDLSVGVPALAAVVTLIPAVRSILELNFDVQEELGVSLWGWTCSNGVGHAAKKRSWIVWRWCRGFQHCCCDWFAGACGLLAG